MPTCQTKFHGSLEFEPDQVLRVPAGLFGFPDENQFLLLELPSARPIVFIQSIKSANLCFISLPVQVLEPSYELSLQAEELKTFGYPEQERPQLGKDLLCLALMTVGARKAATANLLAPVVIDIAGHQGMQVIVDGPYSHHQQIPAERFTASVD